ncbi:hypothetical protein NPIL_443681 [Nephila pilipes]|uniref:Secreted protein n=1 Tax=Nephila pilipes TaxID=299642 RepID=A0A8X6TBT9_NEPPI|nr:hypothetical protein NPIL_443681 [Nephila pilipes]
MIVLLAFLSSQHTYLLLSLLLPARHTRIANIPAQRWQKNAYKNTAHFVYKSTLPSSTANCRRTGQLLATISTWQTKFSGHGYAFVASQIKAFAAENISFIPCLWQRRL